MADQTLPHSLESERALLGAALLKPETMDIAMGLIPSPEAFYQERHRMTWEALVELRSGHEPIDIRTVQAALERRGAFDKAGGLAFLAALDDDLPLTGLGSVQAYCGVVLDRWARRRAVAASIELREMAMNGHSSDEMIERTAAALEEINRDRSGSEEAPTADVLLGEYDPESDEEDVEVVPTGLADLDALVGGFEPGQLIVWGGRPSHGKTAFATQFAQHACSAICRVRIQSLEMEARELRSRLLCQASGVDYKKIHRHQMTTFERQAVGRAKKRLLGELGDRFRIDARPGLTLGQISASAAVEKLRRGLHVLIVDHSMLIGWRGREPPIRERVGILTSGLKSLAKELQISVVLLHHLSRRHEEEQRAPAMRDLIESSSVERDADVIMLFWRPEKALPPDHKDFEKYRGQARILIPKHRNGRDDVIDTAFLGERMLFAPLSKREEPPF